MQHTSIPAQLPIRIPNLLLPHSSINPHFWACIACDQYTHAPQYWNALYSHIGEAPSTAKLIVPEAYLSTQKDEDFEKINKLSKTYLESGVLTSMSNTAVLVKRQTSAGIRTGIVMEIDLSQYRLDPTQDGRIFATEKVVPSRIETRVKARKHSILDLSHTLVLYNDAHGKITRMLEPATYSTPLYDVSLYGDGGNIKGYSLKPHIVANVFDSWYRESIQIGRATYFLVGDGNHSLVAAKNVWEERGASMNDPHRWALVELVNLFDEGLPILPIHRITTVSLGLSTIKDSFGMRVLKKIEHDKRISIRLVDTPTTYGESCLYLLLFGKCYQICIESMDIASMIEYVDSILLSELPSDFVVDFVHDATDVWKHAFSHPQLPQVICPSIEKSSLFWLKERGTLLPRKCFSLGQDRDKRYYFELRSLA